MLAALLNVTEKAVLYKNEYRNLILAKTTTRKGLR
jgi:hypothetical protein